MIGSGIFICLRKVRSAGGSARLAFGAWALAEWLTITGALCCAELAAMMRRAADNMFFCARPLAQRLVSSSVVAVLCRATEHDCGGRGRAYRQLHGRVDDRVSDTITSFDPFIWEATRSLFQRNSSSRSAHTYSDLHEHSRIKDGQANPKYFYLH